VVAGIRDEADVVPGTPAPAESHGAALRLAPALKARLEGHAPVDAAIPTTVTTKPKQKVKKPVTGQPLKVTPPIEGGPYDFPVAGQVSYGDTYGAARSDVPGGWHHGDDIFAPIGTPVVAVADGTINRAGWEVVGGWRLWVRDRVGDEFYYAHLSGYTALALRDGRVKRGEVIGFVGNTGDAFTTLPHLHFEVHPRNLLHLGYGGAVDPTSYLESWAKPGHVVPPAAVHPHFPGATEARYEAATNFRELLRVHPALPRPKVKKRPPAPAPPPPVVGFTRHPTLPVQALRLPPPVVAHASRAWRWATTDAIAAVAVLGLMMWRDQLPRRRRTPAEVRLDAAMAAARAELDANLATLRAMRRAAERSRRTGGRPHRGRLPVR